MNPPNLIMIVSLIIRCIMRLLGFQCNELAAPAEGPRLQKCRLGQPICRGDAAPSRLLAHGKQPTRRSLDPRAPRSLAKTARRSGSTLEPNELAAPAEGPRLRKCRLGPPNTLHHEPPSHPFAH